MSMGDQLVADERARIDKGPSSAKRLSEQGMLMDVGPKHAKEIAAKARAYRALVAKRQAVLEEEVELKRDLAKLIGEEHLKRLPDGTIQFHLEGMTVTVVPRDELIRVKEDHGPGDAD